MFGTFRLACAFALVVALTGCVVIQNPQPEDCVVETVDVGSVVEGPSYDVQLKLEGGSSRYVNRGLENGPDLAQWRQWLEGETVTLHVVKRSRHIAKITLGDGTVVHDEFDSKAS